MASRPALLQLGKYYHPVRGGMERLLHEQCRALNEDFDLSVVVANTAPGTTHDDVDGVSVTRVGRMGEVFGTPMCPTLPYHVRKRGGDPDGVVHVHAPNPMAHLSYALAGWPGRLVVTWHSDLVGRRAALDRVYRWALRGLLDRAALIIATSPAYIDSSPYLRPLREKCVVLPPAVDLSRFEVTAGDPRLSESLREEHGDRIVLFVGRLSHYKGLDVLLAAAPRIEARLLIVGDGPLREHVRRSIRRSALEDRAVLLPSVSDEALPSYYHACDVFVLPSNRRAEAFGIVQLEAMACSRPVVSTQLDSGVPWVNRDGETGLTVPRDDPGRLAEAINRLLSDESERVRMGENGRAHVARSFSTEVIARRSRDVFRSVQAGQVPES